MVDGNKLGSVGFEYLGRPYSEMDCQAFVERCLRDCGWTIDLGGSNTWYRKVRKEGELLTPEECTKKYGTTPKGAFLFIHSYDGKEPAKYREDGLGNASHIGLCTGKEGEGAIHSSYTRQCVAESKYKNKSINGGWNCVGLLPKMISYDEVEPAPGPSPSPEPEPSPEPAPITATVWSENGKHVHLRKRASRLSSVVDNVPCGAEVDVLEYGDDWCRLAYRDARGATWYGYMMTKFLVFEERVSRLFTVTIRHVSYAQAEELKSRYSGVTIEEE